MSRNLLLLAVMMILSVTNGCQKSEPVDVAKPKQNQTAPEAKSIPKAIDPVVVPKDTPKEPIEQTKPRTIHEGDTQTDSELKEIGVHRFDSKSIRLYTDIPKEQADSLPLLIDQLLPVWANYYSKIPQERTKRVFPLTGYVINDQDLFVQTGLLPETVQLFEHGEIRDGRFWMKQQKTDYYRRHLLLHEATHGYMTSIPNGQPIWYLEGMAEFFAVHRIDNEGKIKFGVIPQAENEFDGFGRIRTIQQEIEQGRFLSIRRIRPLRHEHFLKFKAPYAWSWALCIFLDGHPRYQKLFREIGQLWTGTEFQKEFSQWLKEEGLLMEVEWAEFAHHLTPGVDLTHFPFEFKSSEFLPDNQTKTIEIEAAKGWQSTGIVLEAGKTYQVRADGQFYVAQKPKPWMSEPQGVRIRYVNGQPLGQLQGMILEKNPLEKIPFKTFAVGREKRIAPISSGTLFLRINDSYAEMSDNGGSISVTINARQKK